MDSRTKIGILLIVYSIQAALSAPVMDSSRDFGVRVRRSEDKESGRIFWSAVGDVLESLPFLPFTVNVPDVVSNMWSFFTGFLPGSSSSESSSSESSSSESSSTSSTSSGSSGVKKKPKRNSTQVRVTGDDLLDYFLY